MLRAMSGWRVAEIRWAIFCHRASIDKLSNVMSLLEIADELSIQTIPEVQEADNPALLLDHQLVSTWDRSQRGKQEKFLVSVTVTTPDGETHDPFVQVQGDLEENVRTRLVIQIQSIPFRGSGTYWFNLRYHPTPDDEGSIVTRVPLDLKLESPGPSSPNKL